MENRELDALIAEKIMGWTDVAIEILGSYGKELMGTNPKHKHNTRVPNYSTDIAAAWTIVERLQERYYSVELIVQRDSPNKWRVHIFGQRPEYASTMPMAICLAALRAVGIEVKE